MKRLLFYSVAVALALAIAAPAGAVTVKVTGEFFAAGFWESNRALRSSDETAQRYYASRLQVNPVFQVADGLRLVTRFDAMERVWGQDPIGSTPTATNSRNTKDEQNIVFRRAYLSAKVLGGVLDVGVMGGGRTGTVFMNYDADVYRIKYTTYFGPWSIQLVTEKADENSITNGTSDGDKDKYSITPVYKWTGGEVGTQFQWYRYNDQERSATPYRANYYLLCPWFKSIFGPLYVEGEVSYYFGKANDYLNESLQDKDYDSLNYYLMAKYTTGPFYFGGQYAHIAGDDPARPDKKRQASAPSGYIDYQPTLVLWNDWTQRFTGQALGTNGTIASPYYVTNANLYQVFAGYKPIPKLTLDASYTMAYAEQKPANYVSDGYGNELDLKAAYKIYDNLEYMVAFGYLWAGDYFKGTSSTNTVGNDWLLMHKLTLNF